MKDRTNRRRFKLRKNQFEVNNCDFGVSAMSEFLYGFYDTGRLTTEISIDEQLENMDAVEELAYQDGINKAWFKFKTKK